jgi:hypothetical protein
MRTAAAQGDRAKRHALERVAARAVQIRQVIPPAREVHDLVVVNLQVTQRRHVVEEGLGDDGETIVRQNELPQAKRVVECTSVHVREPVLRQIELCNHGAKELTRGQFGHVVAAQFQDQAAR